MRREPHVRFCERAVVRFRRATHLVVGFEHQADARRFLAAMRLRFEEFALSLHPDKTRLIEFGRRAAANRPNSISRVFPSCTARPNCFNLSVSAARSSFPSASC